MEVSRPQIFCSGGLVDKLLKPFRVTSLLQLSNKTLPNQGLAFSDLPTFADSAMVCVVFLCASER